MIVPIPLFRQFALHDVLQHREQEMFEDIKNLSEDQLLSLNLEELADYFEAKYAFNVPTLKTNSNDIRSDRKRNDKGQTVYVFHVPFEGDMLLFSCDPSRSTISKPRASIEESYLTIEIVIDGILTGDSKDSVSTSLKDTLESIETHLNTLRTDVRDFNSAIRLKITHQLEQHRQRILKEQELLDSLGFTLVERKGMPQTYIAPTVRKKLPTLPPVAQRQKKAEPVLDMEHYEHILSVINNMAYVMERSPNAFRDLQEEDLRWHFLFSLNSHYEGQATGETFNYQGKTDILIRAEDRNIFIAECKFWNGATALHAAFNQILERYITWRDTKVALLIFNKNKDFSAILTTIKNEVVNHPNYKNQLQYSSETGFRYVFRHNNDESREMLLTILAFDIPIE